MSNIKPTKTQMFNGLRRRPKYAEISQEIKPRQDKGYIPKQRRKVFKGRPQNDTVRWC